jgi:hypothetical protein
MAYKHAAELDMPSDMVRAAITEWHNAGWSPERIRRRLDRLYREYAVDLQRRPLDEP